MVLSTAWVAFKDFGGSEPRLPSHTKILPQVSGRCVCKDPRRSPLCSTTSTTTALVSLRRPLDDDIARHYPHKTMRLQRKPVMFANCVSKPAALTDVVLCGKLRGAMCDCRGKCHRVCLFTFMRHDMRV